jgi:hypothetical protein
MNPDPERNEDERDPDIAPSLRRHITMQSIFEIGCSVVAPGAWVFYKFYAGHGIGISVTDGAVFFGLFVLGYLIPHAVFRHFVGAACPSPACRGKAFPKGRNPVIYVCTSCRLAFPTGLSEGGDSL